ncbi:hypothetical protein [Halocatena halophila]|uniref:hypothetical protein n=1 Tax=Halocatena halophila TaxID=2814576 RepID=UPI002ED21CCE
MLVPSTISPRADDCTPAQHEALRAYCARYVEQPVWYRDPLLFALVLAGDKPAADITAHEFAFPNHRWAPHRGLFELCELFDLSTRRIGPGVASDWFVAPNGGRLDLLPSTDKTVGNLAWHRRLGTILGYPPSAIEFFATTPPGERTQPSDLVRTGQFSPQEIAYTRFVFYVHDDSIERYEQAIEEGKQMRDRFSTLQQRWNLPALNQIATGVYEAGVEALAELANRPHQDSVV